MEMFFSFRPGNDRLINYPVFKMVCLSLLLKVLLIALVAMSTPRASVLEPPLGGLVVASLATQLSAGEVPSVRSVRISRSVRVSRSVRSVRTPTLLANKVLIVDRHILDDIGTILLVRPVSRQDSPGDLLNFTSVDVNPFVNLARGCPTQAIVPFPEPLVLPDLNFTASSVLQEVSPPSDSVPNASLSSILNDLVRKGYAPPGTTLPEPFPPGSPSNFTSGVIDPVDIARTFFEFDLSSARDHLYEYELWFNLFGDELAVQLYEPNLCPFDNAILLTIEIACFNCILLSFIFSCYPRNRAVAVVEMAGFKNDGETPDLNVESVKFVAVDPHRRRLRYRLWLNMMMRRALSPPTSKKCKLPQPGIPACKRPRKSSGAVTDDGGVGHASVHEPKVQCLSNGKRRRLSD